MPTSGTSPLIAEIRLRAQAALARAFTIADADVSVEIPADRAYGDLTLNAFAVARQARQAPPRVASALAEALSSDPAVAEARAVKGYVNLLLQPRFLFACALDEASAPGYGTVGDLAGQRILVEYSAPNTNKPLHLGHMRNNFLGHSVSAILAAAGARVIRVNLLNDRGIHICKSMLAYRKFGEGATPESTGRKGDHFVGDYYVLFEQRFQDQVRDFVRDHPEDFAAWKAREGPAAGDEAADRAAYLASLREEGFARIPLGAECTEMLRQWEEGDPGVHALWRLMNGWAEAGFAQTYREQGVEFDHVYRESETWKLGRQLILDGLARGVFARRPDGAVEIDLRAEGLDRKVVLRADGTAVYITQDIGCTVRKAEDHSPDRQIWVVGDEQRFHLQVLFTILAKMGYTWASRLQHLAYGMVSLPEGKMKSREGRVVDADDLFQEVSGLASAEIRARDPEGRIDAREVDRRARVVGLSALRFMLLKVAPANPMLFNPAESVRFEGDTGARVLYAYARLRSILADAPMGAAEAADPARLGDDAERHLAVDLAFLGPAVRRAARDLNPGAIAGYLLELVRDLNRFYDRCPVLREPDPALAGARLRLCAGAARALERATSLLGMPLLERM
jgi:arginyl-tRNA synthetase